MVKLTWMALLMMVLGVATGACGSSTMARKLRTIYGSPKQRKGFKSMIRITIAEGVEQRSPQSIKSEAQLLYGLEL